MNHPLQDPRIHDCQYMHTYLDKCLEDVCARGKKDMSLMKDKTIKG